MTPRRLDRCELRSRLCRPGTGFEAWAIEELADAAEGAALTAMAKADKREADLKRRRNQVRKPDPAQEADE